MECPPLARDPRTPELSLGSVHRNGSSGPPGAALEEEKQRDAEEEEDADAAESIHVGEQVGLPDDRPFDRPVGLLLRLEEARSLRYQTTGDRLEPLLQRRIVDREVREQVGAV